MLRILLVMMALFSFPAYSQEVKIAPSIERTGIELVEDAKYFIDSSNQYDLHEVVSDPMLFSKKPDSFFDYIPCNVWVKFTIKNTSAKPVEAFTLKIGNKTEQINTYVFNKDSLIKTYPKVGWGIPVVQRPYPHYKSIFPFSIPSEESFTFYFRVNNRYQPFTFPLLITDREYIVGNTLITSLSDGFVMVLTLFIFILSLFLLYDSDRKDRLYIWYCIYCFSGFLYYFLRYGIQYFTPVELPPFLHYLVEIPTVFVLASYTMFGMSFMKAVKLNRKLYTILQTGMLIMAFVTLTSLFIPPMPSPKAILIARSMLMFLSLLCVLYPLVMGIIQKNIDSYLYIFMGPPILAVYLLLFLWTNIFPGHSSFDRVLMVKIIVIIEATIMLFSVFYKSKQAKLKLYRQISEKEKQILQTQITVQESERKRIAIDLHDEIGSTVATIKRLLAELREMKVPETIKKITDKANFLISETNDDIRRITHNLMPPNFEKLGLKSSLQYLTQRAGSKSLAFDFICFGQEARLGTETDINLYRMVSELIHNVQKHSGATKAAVQLIYYPQLLLITVEDNGKGFPKDSTGPGSGLNNIRLRADYIGASVRFDSGQGGTHVTLELALESV